MTKRTFKNKEYPNYKIMVKLIDHQWHIYCKDDIQCEWHLCYVDNFNDTWTCIVDYENCKDTSRMFDYTVDIYNNEVIGR